MSEKITLISRDKMTSRAPYMKTAIISRENEPIDCEVMVFGVNSVNNQDAIEERVQLPDDRHRFQTEAIIVLSAYPTNFPGRISSRPLSIVPSSQGESGRWAATAVLAGVNKRIGLRSVRLLLLTGMNCLSPTPASLNTRAVSLSMLYPWA